MTIDKQRTPIKIRRALATAALALLPLAASPQQPTTDAVSLVGPGQFAGVVEETHTSTVESIDQAARSVVLKRANGELLKVTAAPAKTKK